LVQELTVSTTKIGAVTGDAIGVVVGLGVGGGLATGAGFLTT